MALTDDEVQALSGLESKLQAGGLSDDEAAQYDALDARSRDAAPAQAPTTTHFADALNSVGAKPLGDMSFAPQAQLDALAAQPSPAPEPGLLDKVSSGLDSFNKIRTTPIPYTGGVEVQDLVAPPLAAVHTLDWAKKNVIDPYVTEPLQEFARDRMFGKALNDIGEISPGAEYAARNIGQLAIGPFTHSADVNAASGQNNMGDREAAGINQLETATNVAQSFLNTPEAAKPYANAYIQALMQEMPKLPIYLLPGVGKSEGVLGTAAHGASAGALAELVTPGGTPSEGALAGGVLGGGIGAVGKALKSLGKAKPVVEAFVPGHEVQQFASELSRATPAPKSGEASAHVVDVGEDGTPFIKRVEMTAQGPRITSEQPVTAVARPRGPRPLITDAAAEQLTDAELEALRSQPADVIRRKLAGARDVTIFTDKTPPEQLAQNYPTLDAYENGAVVVSDGEGLRIQDINDPALKRASLTERALAEVTLPDGSKQLGFVGTPLEDPSMRILLAPDPAEGLADALPSDQAFPAKSVRLIDDPQELDDVIRYSQGWRTTKPGAPANAVPPGGLPPEPPPLPMDGSGPNGEPPGPPPGPGQVPKNFGPQMNWWQKLGNVGQGVLNRMVGSHSRGPADLAQLAQTAYSVEQGAFNKTFKDVYAAVNKRFALESLPTEGQVKFHQDLNNVLEGKQTPADMAAKWPQYAKEQHDVIGKYKAAIDADQQRLKELGFLDPAETRPDIAAFKTDQDFADYAARTYLRYMMPPGEYAKYARKDAAVMNKWRKWLYDNSINTPESPHRLRSEAEKQEQTDILLNQLIGGFDSKGAPTGTRAADFLKSFKRREDIPEMVRQIMGETDNGLYRLALTRARQKAAVANAEMWGLVHERPDVWSEFDKVDPLTGKPWPKLPNDRSRYGLMAGKTIDPDWHEALVEAPKAAQASATWLGKVSRHLKTNQVLLGGAGPWLNNVMGNFSGLAMAGGVNPFTATPEIARMANDFKAYKLEAGAEQSEAAKRVVRARELFGSFGGWHKGETKATVKDLERYLAYATTPDGKPLQRSFAQWVNDATLGNVGKTVDKLGNAFDGVDQVSKYISWTGLLKKGGIDAASGDINPKMAQKFLGPQFVDTTPARLKALVEREAARRVHMSFPFMDRTGPWVRKLQNSAGVANPYVGVKTEIMRTYMLAAKRAAEGEPGMRARMLAYAAVGTGLALGAQELRRANGISDDDVEQGKANMPDSVKKYHPGMGALWWRDDKGRVQYWDFGQGLLDPVAYAQGEPSRDLLSRVLGNVASTPFEGGLLNDLGKEVLYQYGLADPPFDDPRAQDQLSNAQVLDKLWAMGLGPTAIPRALNQLQKGGVIGQRNPLSPAPQLTPAQGITNAIVGNRVLPAGGPENKALENAFQTMAANKALKRGLGDQAPERITGPLQGLFGGDRRQKAIEEFRRKMQENQRGENK